MSFSAYSLYYFTFTQYLFSQNLNTSIYYCVSNCQEYSLKWINKTAGFVKCFLVEYLLTAISAMPDISTSVLKQKKYKTDMCSCYKIARLCKLQKKGALDSQPQVIKLTSCLHMVGGSVRLPPLLKLVVMI